MTIKELREKYNLTQSALARSLGVSSNAISGIEGGRIRALCTFVNDVRPRD